MILQCLCWGVGVYIKMDTVSMMHVFLSLFFNLREAGYVFMV